MRENELNQSKTCSSIHHLSDIEGNWDYLKRWTARSAGIGLDENGLYFKKPQQAFVFGGDLCDKGPGDLRVVKAFVDFQKKYPQQVFFMAGNRDIKYRRFSYELLGNIYERLLYGEAPFWNQAQPPRLYALKCMQQENKGQSLADLPHYLKTKSQLSCQSIYLKWMLEASMGCGSSCHKPTTFEYRRQELAILNHQDPASISDEAITESFLNLVSPEGFMTKFLEKAQLVKIIGETLFLHGAITLENMGYLPSSPQQRITNAKEWFDALNAWYSEEIKAWQNHPEEKGCLPPAHRALDHYVLFNPRSIVPTNWYQKGQLKPIPKAVIDFLNQAGIYRVVSGHQPFGDFPLILRTENLEVIVADTSYSDSKSAQDNRGKAIHNLEISLEKQGWRSRIQAIKKDGCSFSLILPSKNEVRKGKDSPIGHFTKKGELLWPHSQNYLCPCQINGFEVKAGKPILSKKVGFLL